MVEPIFNYNIHKSVLQEPNVRVGPVSNVPPAPFNIKPIDKPKKADKSKKDPEDKDSNKKKRPFE